MNAAQLIAIVLDALIGETYRDSACPMVRFNYPHEGKNPAQTLNRELDRNTVRSDLLAEAERRVRARFGDDEITSILGHHAWSPSISKSVVTDEWIMTIGIGGLFAIAGTDCTGIAKYAKQGFGHPRIYWHGADGIRTDTLPEAL